MYRPSEREFSVACAVHVSESIEDITWWREDMNFILEWWKQYFMNERSESE